jgi:hypothetical protein
LISQKSGVNEVKAIQIKVKKLPNFLCQHIREKNGHNKENSGKNGIKGFASTTTKINRSKHNNDCKLGYRR